MVRGIIYFMALALRKGLLFIISSPSGAGKSTLCKLLLASDDNIKLSVSATTRERRLEEVDGVHYDFISQDQFDEMSNNGEFLEYATVFQNSYGTPRAPVEAALERGMDILFDIDWQGTLQLQHSMKENVVSIFILPPSMKELERRLRSRASDTEDVIQHRMSRAASEISKWDHYDYVLVNDDIQETLGEIKTILSAERMKKFRNHGLKSFIEKI